MLPRLRSSETKYTSLDSHNGEAHSPYRPVTNAITLFWREVVIFFLAIVCAVLALEHTYYPLNNHGDRAKVPEYGELSINR